MSVPVLAMAVAGGLTGGGLLLLGRELVHIDTELSTGFFTRLRKNLRDTPRAVRRRAAAAIVAGLVAGALSGWPLLGLLVALGVVGLPWLLAGPPQRDIEVLEALDRWIRALTVILPTGRSVSDAIRVSRRQAPALLEAPVELVVRRLDERWTPREALLAMADELDCPEADAPVAALALAAERGGTGATATLAALADSVQDRLRARREIETERSKPRIVVRQVTIITLALLGLAFLFGREFFAPYRTGVGQIILACLIAAYVGSLVMLRTMTQPRRRARILRRAS